MTKFKGYVLQHGTSPVNGDPFVVIMTMESANTKTGNMCQVWILHENLDPVDAVTLGADDTVCGDCPHRKQSDGSRSCYVNVGQAPAAVWKSYKRGIYGKLSDLNPSDIEHRKIRWGAYGDPAMISPSLVALLNEHAAGHTGYTHQWSQPWAQWCRECSKLRVIRSHSISTPVLTVGRRSPSLPRVSSHSVASSAPPRKRTTARLNASIEAHLLTM